VIDSWDELHSRKEFRITISDYSLSSEFSEEDNILNDLKARIDDKIRLNYRDSDTFPTLFENITKTNRVFIAQKHSLRSYFARFGQSFKDSLHISEYGGGISPYSLVINPLFESQLEIDINKM
jgi:hypothetical protein